MLNFNSVLNHSLLNILAYISPRNKSKGSFQIYRNGAVQKCPRFFSYTTRKLRNCKNKSGACFAVHPVGWLLSLALLFTISILSVSIFVVKVILQGVQQNCIHFCFCNFSASWWSRNRMLGIFELPRFCRFENCPCFYS